MDVVLEEGEPTEGVHNGGSDEEHNDASEATDDVVPEEATPEGGGDTEADEDEGDQVGAVGQVLHEAGDLVGGAASSVFGSNNVVAAITGVNANVEG